MDKSTKILFWIAGTFGAVAIMCGGAGIIASAFRTKDPLSQPGQTAHVKRQLEQATAEVQAERVKLIRDASTLIYKADSRTMDVWPLWEGLPLDDKRAAAAMVWLWANNAKSLVAAVGTDEAFRRLVIRDCRTGKQVATFSPGEGLKID